MSYNWGPHFIVPSDTLKKFSGHVLLREYFDEDLLNKELKQLGLEGIVEYVTNPWYYRKWNTSTWIKIGESENIRENFPVSWDTSCLKRFEAPIRGLFNRISNIDVISNILSRKFILIVRLL